MVVVVMFFQRSVHLMQRIISPGVLCVYDSLCVMNILLRHHRLLISGITLHVPADPKDIFQVHRLTKSLKHGHSWGRLGIGRPFGYGRHGYVKNIELKRHLFLSSGMTRPASVDSKDIFQLHRLCKNP